MANSGAEIDAIGQWAVLDFFQGHATLLAVGDTEFGGVSARNKFDRRSRTILLDALYEAIHTESPIDRIVDFDTDAYAVRAHPIIVPDGDVVIGAFGAFCPIGGQLAERPLIGTWQWSVNRHTGESFRSAWDTGLHQLHEYDPDLTGRTGAGPAAFWFTHLIPEIERAKLLPLINEGVRDADGRRQLLAFDGITRYGTPNPGRKHLAVAANAVPDAENPGNAVMRGFTRQIAQPGIHRVTGVEAIGSDQILDAVLEIIDSSAVAAFDMLRGRVFMRSSGWASSGLYDEFSGDIVALADPCRKAALETFLNKAARSRARSGPMRVDLMSADGEYLPFCMTVFPIGTRSAVARYLAISLNPRMSECECESEGEAL